MNYFLIFISALISTGLKSAQQLNVARYRYVPILPISFAMSFFEVYMVAQAAKNGLGPIVIVWGAGAGLGCMAAMWVSEKYLDRIAQINRSNKKSGYVPDRTNSFGLIGRGYLPKRGSK